MEKLDKFKIELRNLLEQYNATIACNVEGDTHGLSYEMVVEFGSADAWREYQLSDGAAIDCNDLK